MKILGIGVDIIENKRIRNLINNKSFVSRTFGEKEMYLAKKFKNKINYYAKRFAAKEAFAKALGIGISKGLNFNEIEVKNNNFGKPSMVIKANSLKVTRKILKKKFKVFLSLSDDKPYAIAIVILTI